MTADAFPVRVYRTSAETDADGAATWRVDWCRLGPYRFTDPFFDGTVRRCESHPFNLAFRPQTRLDDLGENPPDVLPLAGLIFHLSRCGSTLVAQTFAADPETVVLAEPGPVDDVLRAARFDAGVTDAWRIARVRAIVAALVRRRHPEERRAVVKLDAWHVFDLALIERAFPGVPWCFVYRDPLDVLVSHARTPSWFMSLVNAPSLLGTSLADAARMPREAYHARMLGRICDAVASAAPDPERLIPYADLPHAIEHRIAPAFGIALGARERAAMRRDAKHPSRIFVPDAAEKRAEATDAMRAAADRYVAEPFARLERIRAAAQDNRDARAVSAT